MTRKPKRPRDMNQLAKLIVDMTIGEAPPDIKLTKKQTAGRKGGIKGGTARKKALTSERRTEIAKKAAAARWKK